MVEEYDEMDENELADLVEEAHGFNVPNEPNRNEQPVLNNEEEEIVFEEEEIVFVNPNDDNEPAEINASDEEYEDSENEDLSLDADKQEDTNPNLRRTNRVRTPNASYGYQHLVQAANNQIKEYTEETALIIAYTMCHYNDTMARMNDVEAYSFIQTYSFNKGLKKFGELGRKAAHKEMQQLNDRVVFEPTSEEEFTGVSHVRTPRRNAT
jgi:hypothetical protein